MVLIHKVVVFFYLLIWPVGRHPQPVVELSTTGLGRRHISHYGCQARQVCYRNRGRHIFAKIIFILAQVSSPWQAYNLKAHLVLNNRRIQRPVTYTRMCTGWGREGRGFLKGGLKSDPRPCVHSLSGYAWGVSVSYRTAIKGCLHFQL